MNARETPFEVGVEGFLNWGLSMTFPTYLFGQANPPNHAPIGYSQHNYGVPYWSQIQDSIQGLKEG